MRVIYEIDTYSVWTGGSREITDRDGRPSNWIHSETTPPTLSGTEVAQWVGTQWVVLPEYPTPEPTPAPVPRSVTMRQARLALLGAGLLSSIDEAIDSLPEPEKSAAHIEWEYAQEIERNRPFVQLLTPTLGLTEEQVDQLFITAATL